MGKFQDLTGKQFGYWTVLEHIGIRNKATIWKCRCVCGAEREITAESLTHGNSKSCGCKKGEIHSNPSKYIGKRFGRVVVESYYDSLNGHSRYKCRCDCGNEKIFVGTELRRIQNPSCNDCKISPKYVHGMTDTRIHIIWMDMRSRCADLNNPNYGGRGIKVCDEWSDDFQAFYEWAMDNGYTDELTIDRIDNEKGYSPENCRWANAETQANNKRNNIYIEYKGKTQTIPQWSRELGIKNSLLRGRYYRGWSAEDIFTIPAQKIGTNQTTSARKLNNTQEKSTNESVL